MDVFEAIYTRYSQGKVRPDPVPRELIEKLLDAAVQAPNHYKVRPWRFVVLTGEGRDRLGEVMAASQQARHPEYPIESFDKCRSLPLRAPVVIAVGVDQPGGRLHAGQCSVAGGNFQAGPPVYQSREPRHQRRGVEAPDAPRLHQRHEQAPLPE